MTIIFRTRSFLALVLAALSQFSSNSPATAHEFWLDPVTYTPKAGASVPIVQRTGINFLGDSYPFERKMSQRFAVVDARGERPIKAVEGDDPAAEPKLANAGLAIIVYQRAPDIVVHPTLERFTEIVAIEGLDHIAVQHRETALPVTGIKETYTRYAKTLLKVGNVSGADRAVGLPFELILEADPYTLAPSATLPVRALVDGKPVANILIKAHNRADPGTPRQGRTDADGRVQLVGVPSGEVLISGVAMARATDPAQAEWTSLWASLTFKRP